MNRIQRFFYGRNGTDQLNVFLLAIYLIFAIVTMFVRWQIFYIIMLVLFGITLWRSLSKNLEKRRKENECFLRIWKPVAQFFKLPFLRIRDRKTHKYVKCPSCKKYMRIRKGKGEREINCPICNKRFKVKS